MVEKNSVRRDRTPFKRSCSAPKRAEARAEFFGQQLRLLKRSEMSALRKLIVVDQIGVGFFRPLSRRPVDFVRERAHRDRHLHTLGAEKAELVFPIEAR